MLRVHLLVTLAVRSESCRLLVQHFGSSGAGTICSGWASDLRHPKFSQRQFVGVPGRIGRLRCGLSMSEANVGR